MKANKLKYIALSGAFMLLTAFATISCDDANDWTTDSSYNRNLPTLWKVYTVTASILFV